MPQLDKYIFIPTVFWLVLLFLFLYFLLLRQGLPIIFKILRYRNKFLTEYNLSLDIIEKEVVLLKADSANFDISFVQVYKGLSEDVYRVIDESFSFCILEKDRLFVKKQNYSFKLTSLFTNLELVYRLRLISSVKFLQQRNAILSKVLK